MQHAVIVKADGSEALVTADGKELGSGDIDRRVLHILPKVFVPSELVGKIALSQVILDVSATGGVDIVPPGGIVIRQPYPNTRYFVGGSEQSRNGWVINVPADISEFDIDFEWEFLNAWKWWEPRIDDLLIRQKIHVKLLPGDARTYTMDVSCWPRGDAKHVDQRGSTPVALMGHVTDEDPRCKGLRDIIRIDPLVSDDDDQIWGGQYIEESLSIPPIPYEKAWSINAFSEPQIHEVVQVSTFTTHNDVHEKNASHVMPESVLLEAIRLARTVDYGEGTPYFDTDPTSSGAMDHHPALKLLDQWWQLHRPADLEIPPGHPGTVMPFVRVMDDDLYWCGYYEAPNTPMGRFEKAAPWSARVGNAIVMVFEEDEAYWSLYALRDFPHRFLVAFASLEATAAAELAAAGIDSSRGI